MANLTIKNVPEHLHRALKKLAEQEGRSLNAQILDQLSQSVADADRRRAMRRKRAEFRAFVGFLPKLGSSIDLIREDRERGH